MNFRYILLIFVIQLIFVSQAYPQVKKFREFVEELEKEYQQFIEETDREFIKFLKKNWKEFEEFKGFKKEKFPKPVDVPIYEPSKLPKKDEEIKEKKLPSDTPVKDLKKDKPPIGYSIMVVPFFGVPIKLFYRNLKKVAIDGNITNKKISDFWKFLTMSKYESFLKYATDTKNELKLNDWGYFLLLKDISNKLFNNNLNEKRLLVWFFLLKSGYDAKVGYKDNTIYILLPFKNKIYRTPYYIINDKKYYNISLIENPGNIPSLYTYESQYPKTNNIIDLNILNMPILGSNYIEKKIDFYYKGQKNSFLFNINKDLIKFYSMYPSTDWSVYFKSTVSNKIKNSFKIHLGKLIKNKSEKEAVNILLRFVQTSFSYKRDQEHFGKEKTLFAEETIYYNYSDCEDRAVLFSNLVSNLIGLNVIGLHYKGHIATAVKFNKDFNGDSIYYNSEKYIICDPTYINADVGICMPKFKDKIPEIID